jgi:predicted metal-binding membrane protein
MMPAMSVRRADRVVVVGALLGCSAMAWVAVVGLSAGSDMTMPSDMTMRMGTSMPNAELWSADLALGIAAWTAMMTAMMLPATVPMTTVFAALTRRRLTPPATARATAVFVAGYLTTWTGFSAAAALVQQLLTSRGLLANDALHAGLGGVVLVGAGVYQLGPAKRACLRRCRTPIGFLLAEWRDGVAGTAVMGVRHGLWCLGCCLPLMMVLFAVGVMNLAWMAVLAAVVMVEKTMSFGATAARVAGAVLIGLGVWTLTPLMWR